MSREDWNALLLKKMERRNQQIQRAAETFPAPYKVCRKGDKLASRIQSLLGDYDGVKDPIGDKTLEKPIVIPTPTVTTTPVEKSTQSCLGEQQCQRSKSPHDLKAKWDSPSHVQSFAPNEQHSVQAVPPSLLPKLGSLMQKPTAYVCPVDVQKSLKPKTLSKKHCTKAHSSSVGDMKSSSKVSLSKLKIPSQPLEVSMSGDANCVHEILKEMAQSWPPLLTPIRSPCKTAFLKFPFPAKDTPHSHVAEKYGSKASSASHLPKIMLEDYLKFSCSEDSGGKQPDPPKANKPSLSVTAAQKTLKTDHQSRKRTASQSTISSSNEGGESSGSKSNSSSSEHRKTEDKYPTRAKMGRVTGCGVRSASFYIQENMNGPTVILINSH